VSTNGAFPDEMKEVALFTEALRAAVPAHPSRELTATLVPRLAATARSSTIEAETQTTRPARVLEPGRPRSRRALVARIAIAVALIPLLLAGLAFAGVTVPGPARDAFDSVGITLPNQPSHHSPKPSATETKTTSGDGSGGNDVSNAAQTKAKGKGGNSAAAHEHARKQHEKARGKAKGHSQGKAVGLNESTPPGHEGQTGPPANSNAGGSSGSHGSGKAAPHTPHTPNGTALGHTKTPPGQSK
jgi:hypothetical protein